MLLLLLTRRLSQVAYRQTSLLVTTAAAAAAVSILQVPTAICHLDNSQLQAVNRRLLLLLALTVLPNCAVPLHVEHTFGAAAAAAA
jgi:hypothetical protein